MLTDRQIRSAKSGEKPIRMWDGRGLYVELSPSGAKLWRWKYRIHGKEKRMSFGHYPDVPLAEARDLAEVQRRILRRGEDPGVAKQAVKAAERGEDGFEAIAREWHERIAPTLAKAHAARVLRRLEADVFPYVGKRRPDDITPREWLDVLRRIEARGAIETAHRARANCAAVYRYARAASRAEKDPLADLLGALRPSRVRHYASKTEPDELRPILRAIAGYEGSHVVRVALALHPLLFVRPGELRNMRWTDLDETAGQWRFTAPKTGTPHIVPLSRQALAMLAELRPLTGGGTFVFPSLRSGERPISDNTLNAGLRRLGIDTRTEFTSHGWRAAARTILEERLGFRPEVIELQLAHAIRDPLGRAYNRTTHVDERTRMMQSWADFLDELRADKVAA